MYVGTYNVGTYNVGTYNVGSEDNPKHPYRGNYDITFYDITLIEQNLLPRIVQEFRLCLTHYYSSDKLAWLILL